ncbi:MAG: FixH family protein [Hahellaceae bacterium]|nr:FixH family protein [Hahellaceae bacterium]
MQSNSIPVKPWYKQFWPWFLLSAPITSIVLSSIMIVYAVIGKDTLVNDNYYKDGLAINQELVADKAAATMSLTANLRVTNLDHIEVELVSPQTINPPFLKLEIIHPTLDGRDQTVNLFPLPSGKYGSALEAPLTKGRWHLHLMANDGSWRLKGIVKLPTPESIVLEPKI